MSCRHLGVLIGFAFTAMSLADARVSRADVFDSLGIDANSLVSDDVIKALVSFIGFGVQHRPYEPATALGVGIGLDFSMEATLFKVPDSLFQSLSSVGAPATSPVPSLPIGKLHLHKGFGESVDIGTSLFYLTKNWLIGGDIKFVLVEGEEGPTYALRFCYSYADMNFSGISVVTHTYSPQLVVSRRMEFADPYAGFGLEYATGTVKGSVPVSAVVDTSGIPAGTIPETAEVPARGATGFGVLIFGGVSLRVPRSGLRLTMEGAYNSAGQSSMGTKFGFTF